MGLDTPETCRDWRNIVRIICVARWFFFVLVETRTTDSHLKRIISTNCCIHTVVPPDDGPR